MAIIHKGKDHPEIQQVKDICNIIGKESNPLQSDANSCLNCYIKCQLVLFNYCMPQGGQHTLPDHVKLMFDCIQICRITSDFILRESAYCADFCEICAKICEKCAQSCKTFYEDTTMLECAKVCEQCASYCRKILTSM